MCPRVRRVGAELESRGWVNVGKTNLHEFAYGVTSQNLHYGVFRTRGSRR